MLISYSLKGNTYFELSNKIAPYIRRGYKLETVIKEEDGYVAFIIKYPYMNLEIKEENLSDVNINENNIKKYLVEVSVKNKDEFLKYALGNDDVFFTKTKMFAEDVIFYDTCVVLINVTKNGKLITNKEAENFVKEILKNIK